MGKLLWKLDNARKGVGRGLGNAKRSIRPVSLETLVDEEIERRILPSAPSVIFAGLRYYYGNRRSGLDYGYHSMYGSLLHDQYSLFNFDFDRLYDRYGTGTMSKMLWELVFTHHPDYLFYGHWHDIIDRQVLRDIRDSSRTTSIIWLSDDHWRYDETAELCKDFDVIVTTDINGFERRNKEGIDNVVLSQWGCNQYLYRDLGLKRDIDVCFIGQRYGDREEFCESLRAKGIDIRTYGQGWKNSGKVSQSEMIRLMNRSWICLDLSKASKDGVMQVKARPFEVTGCGSLLLTSENKALEQYFRPGEEIVTFADVDDAAGKIKQLLADKEGLKRIASAGRERTLAEHTYGKRFEHIFSEAKRISGKN